MKAIEFVADAQDGIIKVPRKYWKDLEQKLRVIILVDDPVVSKQKNQKKIGKRYLKALSVNTKKLVFDRNEANER